MEKISYQYFDEKFNLSESEEELLPFFHSCDAFWARSIIAEKEFKIRECKVFKEKLAYFFYGRPAYKSSNNESSKLSSLFPISFILDGSLLNGIKRIAPFDTGAFNEGLYNEFMHSGMSINDFLLTPKMKSILKIVAHFFGSNKLYFDDQPKKEIDIGPMDFEAESYHKLINKVSKGEVDDRKSSIEVQIDEDLVISKDLVKAVIIPDHFADSKYIQDIVIKEWGAKIITYKSRGVASKLYYTHVLHLTEQYLTENFIL